MGSLLTTSAQNTNSQTQWTDQAKRMNLGQPPQTYSNLDLNQEECVQISQQCSSTSSAGASTLENTSKRPREQPKMPMQWYSSNTTNTREEPSSTAQTAAPTFPDTKHFIKDSSMPKKQYDMRHMLNIPRVYGARYDKNLNVWIYLHRIKGGGWVEHDEADTMILPQGLLEIYEKYDGKRDTKHWECVDYPSFNSRRARRWEEDQVEGSRKGNVRVKPKQYKPYEFTIFPSQDW